MDAQGLHECRVECRADERARASARSHETEQALRGVRLPQIDHHAPEHGDEKQIERSHRERNNRRRARRHVAAARR